MEEIDIIELLKRVKEGKAPKEIEVKGKKYNFVEDSPDICCMYKDSEKLCYLISEHIYLDTKIKILDKPIIEPLDDLDLTNARPETNARKINEIIGFINNKESK